MTTAVEKLQKMCKIPSTSTRPENITDRYLQLCVSHSPTGDSILLVLSPKRLKNNSFSETNFYYKTSLNNNVMHAARGALVVICHRKLMFRVDDLWWKTLF